MPVVCAQLRAGWQDFLKRYVQERKSLRVLFHLLDGRHGPVGQDRAIMADMAKMPPSARYVIVLTKVGSDHQIQRGRWIRERLCTRSARSVHT